MDSSGKVWVVTGGGSGIGRELVLALLQRGARVAAVDVRAVNLNETAGAAAAGDRLSLHVVDITDVDAVAALPDAVLAAHGRVDGLLNNAGIIQPFVTVADLDDATIRRVLDVNLMGTISMVRAFLPALLDRTPAHPDAYIANVSSMGGFFPFPGQTIYGAAKAGVKLFTEGLYTELLDTPVGVSVVMPGAVATNITANSGVEMKVSADAADTGMPTTSAPDAARIILEGIAKNKLHIYVGKDARALSIASKFALARTARFVQRKMKGLLNADTGTHAPV